MLAPHIRLVCSCDRHNYGDLLFPIVTRWGLSRTAQLPKTFGFEQYGLKRSNLSAFGAGPSKGMSDLYRDTQEKDVVLLAGGENLAQTWFVMHLTTLGEGAAKRLPLLKEKMGAKFAEKFSRLRFRGRQPFPYILSPDQFRNRPRVMYNSMGGWPLAHYVPDDQKSIVEALAKASFLSVREESTASILRGLDENLHVQIAPDCVFLLSDMISKEELARKALPEVRRMVESAGDFLSFQCHRRYGDDNSEELKRQLVELSNRIGLKIVLTPIGQIPTFNDDVFLKWLADELGSRACILPRQAGIHDVAYALASARMFCGTSLHGVVTALTYGAPFVPLASSDPKLANNIKSWGLSEIFSMTPAAEIAGQASRALELSGAIPAEHSARLRMEARANMNRLAEFILAG